MSEQEQDQLLGNLMSEYREAKRTLALLEYKAHECGRALRAIGAAISEGLMPDEAALIGLLNAEELKRLVNRITDASDRERDLGTRLRSLGLDPCC